jgi:hypothetical protein
MALRTKAEIEAQIQELKKNARTFRKKETRIQVYFYAYVAIGLTALTFFFGWSTMLNIYEGLITAVLAVFCIVFYFFMKHYSRKWSSESTCDAIFAIELDAILKDYGYLNFEELLASKLDNAEIFLCDNRGKYEIGDFGKSVAFTAVEAKKQAYKWILDPDKG